MHDNLYQTPRPRLYLPPGLVDVPVPGDLVPCLIHRGHNGIVLSSSPDREPEPPQIREQDASVRPPVVIASRGVQDRRSRLIGEPADLALQGSLDTRVLRVVPRLDPGIAGQELSDRRGR